MTDAEKIAELETSVNKIFAALPALFAFRDNFELWAKETGVFDHIVQDVLSRVPTSSTQGPKGDTGPKGDQGIQGIQGPAGSGTGSSADVVAQLAAFGINVAQGKVAIGMPVDTSADAQLQIGGGGSAEILFQSNRQGLDGQNPGEVHTNIVSGAGNDGGVRLIQYGNWGAGGLRRNTTNRPMTIFALDSMGDICVSDSRKPYGQVFYLTKDAGGNVTLSTYQVGAVLAIKESTGVYGGIETQKL